MDIEKQWWDAFDSYGSAFELASPNYDKLNKDAQIIGALMKLELDMYNGGFVQFFCNWGHSAYLLALDGLEQIKASATKNLLTEAFSIIDKYEDDERIKSLWDIPTVLSDEDDNQLSQLDEKYWEDKDGIMERMLSHFPKKGIS